MKEKNYQTDFCLTIENHHWRIFNYESPELTRIKTILIAKHSKFKFVVLVRFVVKKKAFKNHNFKLHTTIRKNLVF